MEALEHVRGNHGRGKALLYLRVADEPQHRFLELRPAHLTQYALQHQYHVAHVVQEVARDWMEAAPNWKASEPGYKAVNSVTM